MMPCPRCSERFPEVIGAPYQRCPHCGARIVDELRPTAGPILREAGAHLVKRAWIWWGIFLPAALVANAVPFALAIADPAHRALLLNPFADTIPDARGALELVVAEWVGLLVYFVAWALAAAIDDGALRLRTARWWPRVIGGSAVFAAAVLVLPLTPFFAVLFLFAPVELGRGAGIVDSLAASRALRIRPAGLTFAILSTGVVAELFVYLVGAVPAGWEQSFLLNAAGWWVLAPLVPVLTLVAWERLGIATVVPEGSKGAAATPR